MIHCDVTVFRHDASHKGLIAGCSNFAVTFFKILQTPCQGSLFSGNSDQLQISLRILCEESIRMCQEPGGELRVYGFLSTSWRITWVLMYLCYVCMCASVHAM